jgi:hypothetical protein
MAWKKGESGNPQGRPNVAKQRLQNSFIRALTRDFERHGAYAIARVRRKDPVAYVRVVAGLMPKDLSLEGRIKDEPPQFLPMSATDALLERFVRERKEERKDRNEAVTDEPPASDHPALTIS